MKSIIITLLLSLSSLTLSSQTNLKVSIEKSKFSVNDQLVTEGIVIYFKICSFENVFKEKSKRYKSDSGKMYNFLFLNTGCYVSQATRHKCKKHELPNSVTFDFNYNSQSTPYPMTKNFSGDFYIHGVKIDANTTESDLQFLKQYYTSSEVERMRFDRFYIEFENKLKNPKITSITYKL